METKMINIKIDNIPATVPVGTTILEACRMNGIKIPTLCYLKGLNEIGACRICVVEVKGARSLVASCVYPLDREGTEIFTHSQRVLESRKKTVELLLSDHNQDCLSCDRNQNCELQKMALEFGCDGHKYEGMTIEYPLDTSSPSIVRDNSKCVLCRRCVAACSQIQSVAVIGANARGFDTHIGCAFEKDLAETSCVNCGQCIVACPTGALTEKSEINDVIKALNDPSKHVIIGTAPSVRIGLGEEFGVPMGGNVEGKMAAAMRRMGFDEVFDVDFAADLTIMEEGYEFIDRVKNGGVLPMMTSCSPAWIKFAEHNFPDLLPHISTCKSPQQMFGATCKTYYAKKIGVDPKDIVVVSVMPCTAKKFEKGRGDQSASGYPDIDHVLTTRELAKMIKRFGIVFNDLPDEKFDDPLGVSTGAAVIFGASGGVMEAALRTVVEVLEGKPAASVDFVEVRGTEGIKEATYEVAGIKVNVAVASGLANARKIMEDIAAGKSKYHFIEIMSCPGGCVNGGGQPIKSAFVRNNTNVAGIRGEAIYRADAAMQYRQSHKNPVIKAVYDEYFGEPNSHIAHETLHTSYVARKN